MMQLILTPNGLYKYFRSLVIGYDNTSTEAMYVAPTVGPTVKPLKYFKFGTGAAKDADGNVVGITQAWYKTNCLTKNFGKGNVRVPQTLYAPSSVPDAKKELTADSFYRYGTGNASQVVGVLSAGSIQTGPDATAFWNVPGVLFQVGCHITNAEGNYTAGEDSITALLPGATVKINELGIFDEDDVMVWYAVFSDKDKDSTGSLKVNAIAMMKALDYLIS